MWAKAKTLASSLRPSIALTLHQISKIDRPLMAVAITSAISLRLRAPITTLTFFSHSLSLLHSNPRKPPSSRSHFLFSSPAQLQPLFPLTHHQRCFCAIVEDSKQSGNVDSGEKVGEFRKRLRIADIKGGPDEGLDRLGQNLVVRGWVRTVRIQSSVTFIEVFLL